MAKTEPRALLAWSVLLGAFMLLIALVRVVPSRAAALVEGAARPEGVGVVAVREEIRLSRPGSGPILLRTEEGPATVRPGWSVTTPANAEAALAFFDGSTVAVRPGSVVDIIESRQRVFANGTDEIRIAPRQGRVRITVPPGSDGRRFLLSGPGNAEVALGPGEYLFPVDRLGTYVRAYSGGGTVTAGGRSVRFAAGERVVLGRGGELIGPLPAEVDLIQNGDFRQGEDGLAFWKWDNRDVEQNLPAGVVERCEVDDQPAVRFRRVVDANFHAETYLLQEIKYDVRDFDTIRVVVDFRLIQQSLPGGGFAGSEYPLELRLKWNDQSGQEQVWRYGFYIERPADPRISVRHGHPEPVGQLWTRVERTIKSNAFDSFPPPPNYLVDVQIVASGWSYESAVRQIQILAE